MYQNNEDGHASGINVDEDICTNQKNSEGRHYDVFVFAHRTVNEFMRRKSFYHTCNVNNVLMVTSSLC